MLISDGVVELGIDAMFGTGCGTYFGATMPHYYYSYGDAHGGGIGSGGLW